MEKITDLSSWLARRTYSYLSLSSEIFDNIVSKEIIDLERTFRLLKENFNVSSELFFSRIFTQGEIEFLKEQFKPGRYRESSLEIDYCSRKLNQEYKKVYDKISHLLNSE
jgi:hypothetical protein